MYNSSYIFTVFTEDLLDTADTEGLGLGTLVSIDYKLGTLDSVDLTGDDLTDTDGDGLSLDELQWQTMLKLLNCLLIFKQKDGYIDIGNVINKSDLEVTPGVLV